MHTTKSLQKIRVMQQDQKAIKGITIEQERLKSAESPRKSQVPNAVVKREDDGANSTVEVGAFDCPRAAFTRFSGMRCQSLWGQPPAPPVSLQACLLDLPWIVERWSFSRV